MAPSPDRVPGRQAFLFFPLVDWHTRTQRPQHLAKALANLGHTCIYVNPHLGLEYQTPAAFSKHPRLSMLSEGIFELHVHLPAEHAIDSRMLVEPEVVAVVNAVERVLDELSIASAIQIVSVPSWAPVVTAVRARRSFPIIYDCHDHLAGFDGLSRKIVAAEPNLFECGDHVFFSSQPLMDGVIDRTPRVRPKATLIRNGCWPDHFDPGFDNRRAARTGTIGYVGSLDHWFDIAMLARAAETHPSLTFVLAGRIEDSRIESLARYKNVRFLGELPYASVPAFLHGCDVGIIPFSRSSLTLAANPIKLYEYFSAGLPVVSARLPEVEAYEGLTHIADTPEDFAAAVHRAAQEDEPACRERRLAVARAETWAHRADAILKVADSLRIGRTGAPTVSSAAAD